MAVTVWHPGVVLPAIDLTPAIIMAIKAELTPAQTLALTCWREAEARFEHGRWVPNPVEAMLDILEVIDYRAQDKRWRDRGHKGVCLQRWAFSCWEPKGGPDDPKDADLLAENFEAVIYAAQRMIGGVKPTGKLRACFSAADACVGGSIRHTLPERTTHYFADSMPAWPIWARDHQPVAHRFGHIFFNDIA